MPIDREELFGKLLWVQENYDSFDSESEWTERLGVAMLMHAQGGQTVITELSEDDAEELLDLCDAAAEASGFVLQQVEKPPTDPRAP